MVTIWLVILAVAIVFGITIGIWLSLRRRTSGRTEPFQSQDRETSAKPIIGAVEKPAVCDEGEKDPIELTAAIDLESQDDDHLDLNDDEDIDKPKKDKRPKQKEQTATQVEDNSSAKAPKEQPSETVISPGAQDGILQSPVLSIGESTVETEEETTDSEESPMPLASSSVDSGVAGEKIDMLTQIEPGKTVEQLADETVGTQRPVSESIEVEFTPPKLDKQQKPQPLRKSTKKLYATGDTETESEDTRTAEPILLEDEVTVIKHKTEKEPDRSNGNDGEPVTAKRRETTPRQKPPKYQPTIRTPETTKRNKRQKESERKGSRVLSLKMCVHVVFGLRKRCRVSLLPTRSGDIGEEMEVRGPNGQEIWSVYQDEWYSGILPPNIDKLLKQGSDWEHPGTQTRWVLSGREIYVLAPSPTINGYVSVPRLILGEDHLVLCNKNRQAAVREALAEAGCFQTTIISEVGGVPVDWVLFQSVRPTIPIQHDHEAGIYNILRPLHDLEIVIKGGIRLSHSTWLNGYPPHIRIRGVSGDEPEVMIDGKPASADANGNYSSSGWDKPGLHTVFVGGVTQSYELGDGVQEWSMFDAFVYRPNFAETSNRTIRICGPIVAPNTGDGDVSLTPSTNTCFLGAIPGQIAFSPKPNDVRSSEFLAVSGFLLVWTLPTNPLGSDRSLACVKLIRSQHVVLKHNRAFLDNRENVLRWCYKILEASYKRLRIIPDTVESHELWADYKRAARRLRRQLR